MSIVLFRCANGVVAYRIAQRAGPQGTFVLCLNDNSRGFVPNGGGAPVEAALQQMFQHAAQLRGTVQQVLSVEDL